MQVFKIKRNALFTIDIILPILKLIYPNGLVFVKEKSATSVFVILALEFLCSFVSLCH